MTTLLYGPWGNMFIWGTMGLHVKVSNDQELLQSEPTSHHKHPGEKKKIIVMGMLIDVFNLGPKFGLTIPVISM